MPVAHQFNPELVIVASGFDAAIGDPLGGVLPSNRIVVHKRKS